MNQKNITARLISIILWLFFSTILIGDNLTVSGDDRPGIPQIGSYEYSVWMVTISGTVKTAAGTPVEGVTMSGLPGNPTTNYLGKYTGTFSCGWSGTVIPSKPGYTFYPTYKSYSRVLSNKYNEDYIAAVAVPTYTISGNAGAAGATLSYTDGTPKTVTADTAGIYSLTVPSGWCGTVTPSKSCYNFTPANRVYNNVQANITGEDYIPVPFTYTISGTVKTVDGTPVEGVTMSGLPGNPTTDTYGQYTAAVPCGWCGTVTPAKICYTFTPNGRTYTNIQVNKPAEDYFAVLTDYTISGKVKTTSGTQIAGVVMTGLPGNPVTNHYGQYTVTVPCGWCGTVTPSKICYTFIPSNRMYTNVQANLTCQDYTAAPTSYTISGTVTTDDGIPLADVIMNGLPGNPKTNSLGQYAGAVSCLWSGTVTPSKTCYTFNSPSKNYTNVLANKPDENYIAVSKTYNIAGTIKTRAGTPIAGVTMNGLPGSPITDIYGQYTGTVPCGWSGAVTPFNPCYTFTPTNKSYYNIQSNKTCENYTASSINYTISGTVRTADGKALRGVVMNGLPGNPTTNYSGEYCVTIPCGWSGTVTPSKSCYSFNPAAKTYTNIQAKAPGENYIAVPSTYLISGTIKNIDGTPIEGVAMSGLPGNPVTNPAGQ
ncbi:MAG TPA: hypothetical protein VK469_21470, partial [Candidatus Kapabacteria bacterium]|nr:hypothetical protein [Candidatus Kapabacteria bacterium]